MNKIAIRWLVGLSACSLIGLILFQFYWMGTIFAANEEAFKREIKDILASVALKLEKKEVLKVTIDNFHSDFVYKSLHQRDSNQIELIESTFEKKIVAVQDFLKDTTNRPEWVSFYFNSEKNTSNLQNTSVNVNKDLLFNSNNINKRYSIDTILSDNLAYEKRLDMAAKKSEYVQLALHELFAGERRLRQRVDPTELDSLLHQALKDRGFKLKYEFGVHDPLADSLVLSRISKPNLDRLMTTDLKTSLFPNDVLGEAGILMIWFPKQDSYLLGKIWLTLASSVIFILIVVLCFSYAIHTIFKQKKLSEIKNDFINNMTHEFKTPIATVSLACQALKDKDIQNSEKMTLRYLDVIQDENKRLGTQVEKVLQIAILENADLELKLEHVDVHQIIDQAISNIEIQITCRGGKLIKRLNALHQTVVADKIHLSNIIYNLLDNANKYSSSAPKITIETLDKSSGINISIKDEGIGMSRDVSNKVFDKFYRNPTGNLHDVKGFGLGLTYVKSMIDMHAGSIKVLSSLGKGSTFIIHLPYDLNKEKHG